MHFLRAEGSRGRRAGEGREAARAGLGDGVGDLPEPPAAAAWCVAAQRTNGD